MLYVHLLVTAAFFTQAEQVDGKTSSLQNLQKALATLSNPRINQAQWAKALNELDIPPESPRFWTNIANDPAYSTERRAEAIFKLFERHISPGIKLPELGELLGGAKWLRDADVRLGLRGPSGAIPLDKDGKGQEIYLVIVLETADSNDSNWSIYIKTSKSVDLQALVRLLRNEKNSPDLQQTTLLEYALCTSTKQQDGWISNFIIRSKKEQEGAGYSESTRRIRSRP
jgi:hypothetical protein